MIPDVYFMIKVYYFFVFYQKKSNFTFFFHGKKNNKILIIGTIVPMSVDHKPLSEKEKKRITNAGSTVQFGRINGSLAVSRAFGSFLSFFYQKIAYFCTNTFFFFVFFKVIKCTKKKI